MTIFYVAPTGNDSNTGTSPDPSFATLVAAQQAMEASPGTNTALVAGGTYPLTKTLKLTAADSNNSFIGIPGQTAVLSGGLAVSGWTVGTDGVWSAHVALKDPTQFEVGGVVQTPSRFPNADPANAITGGWLWAGALPAGDDPRSQMAFDPADVSGISLAAGQKITVFTQNGYASDVLTIASVDGQAGVITFTKPATYDIGPGSRYFVAGGAGLMDQPGEWSFDTVSQTLSFLPPAGFDGSGAVASGGNRPLITINGATNVTIQGLTFADVATTASTSTTATPAITISNATSITVDSNVFTNVAKGVFVDQQSNANTISNNTFTHIQSAAIDLTPTSYQNTVTNNTISGSGAVYRDGGAIQVVESWGNAVSHNLIQDVPRFGIEEQNYDPAIQSGGNTFEYNVILHSGQQTPDTGAIYAFSALDPAALGDTIRYNKIIDTGGLGTTPAGFIAGRYMSAGVYLDNYTSNALVYGNFVSGTTNGGVLLHGGANNQVFNNVLLDNTTYGISVQEIARPLTGTLIYNNVIQIPDDVNSPIVTLDPVFVPPASVHDNIYISPTGEMPVIANTSFAAWIASGGDLGSAVLISAGFVDPAAGDYSFAQDSPALARGIQQLPFSAIGPVGPASVPCFAEGTRIATARGGVAVEDLAAGDVAVLADGTRLPVRWVGRRTLDLSRHPDPASAQPIRIAAGAFADGVPARALRLSPDHAVLIGGRLVPARLLVNGASIAREAGCRSVTYYHVELERHGILLAEGLAAESYLDTGNRAMFANGGGPLVLHPVFADAQAARMAGSCAPFATSPDIVEPMWRTLAARASSQGWAVPVLPALEHGPALKVMAGTRRLKPVSVKDGRHTFILPANAGPLTLVSRVVRPSGVRPWLDDRRRLGVRVRRLRFRGSGAVREVPVDDPGLGAGWWAVEWEAGVPCRWTSGNAMLPAALGAGVLEIDLDGRTQYPVAGTDRALVSGSPNTRRMAG